jgi:hypothetical protein
MRLELFLDPHERRALTREFITSEPPPTEVDFIEVFYGKPNLTHAWNEFRLRASVVAIVVRSQAFATPLESV